LPNLPLLRGEADVKIRDLKKRASGASWLVLGALAFAGVAFAEPRRIVALGDSNTYGMNMPREQSYPAQLEAMLRAKGYDVTVTNAGIPGDTTSGGLGRLNSAVPSGTHIAIVVLGVNDARKGVPPAQIEANLVEILSNLKARDVRLVVCGRKAPFPPGYDKEGYGKVYKSLPGRFGAKGCNFTEGVPASGFQGDGHENAEGNTIIAKNMMRLLEPMLTKAKK
jgi:acyl-CoA thioesterase I